jgi:arylsulfatase A-like enzyme
VAVSPWCDALIGDAALALLADASLGRDDVPDLLCIGFTGLDNVGHSYGPDSQEVLEAFVALDGLLAALLAALDEHVGAGRWTLALTSDHGVAPLPEQSGGLRLSQKPLEQAIEQSLVAAHGQPPSRPGDTKTRWLLGIARPSLYVDARRVEDAGLELDAVIASAVQALAAQPGIAAVATRAQLAQATDPDLVALARDVHPSRSGDVLFLLADGAVYTQNVPTDHGSHHNYDRDVPLMLYGAGIVPGRFDRRVAPIDIAPTLARIAGLGELKGIDGRVLDEALASPAAQPAQSVQPPR